jgi:hypothetical protein
LIKSARVDYTALLTASVALRGARYFARRQAWMQGKKVVHAAPAEERPRRRG